MLLGGAAAIVVGCAGTRPREEHAENCVFYPAAVGVLVGTIEHGRIPDKYRCHVVTMVVVSTGPVAVAEMKVAFPLRTETSEMGVKAF
jgi:hypothetical protein